MPVGVILAFAAYAIFCVSDALIKAIGSGISVFELAFFTTAFAVVPAIISNRGERWRHALRVRHPFLIQLRALCAIASTACVMYAFTHIPFADVYAIAFASPILITVLSVFFLKEHMTPTRWAMLALGFLGVLLVIRPGFRTLEFGHVLMMAAALSSAVAAIILRHIAPIEQRISIIAITTLYSLAFNGAMMLHEFTAPTAHQWLMIGLVGLFGGTGQLIIIAATKITPASVVAPIQYSQLIWAILFGAVLYAEYPDRLAIIGLLIVLATGMTNVINGKTRARWKARVFSYRLGQ
ncbi:DMT family transporter [Devosia algicola]|uniref:DMT family transporter n=1 Tax=Devosia algicola TaxID=3026418 RepID=A0ABY7YQX4_9HYPH|nr:DMT family transporter [Devosia algicola]WDR03734.1 DMT family transporter [Devosia algicola]